MSVSLLDRLGARLAAKPAVISIETLFADLEDAHTLIAAQAAQIADLTNDNVKTNPAASSGNMLSGGGGIGQATVAATELPTVVPHISPGVVAHVHQLMLDAEERLSVNALGSVADFIAKAKNLLTGKA